MRLRLYLIVGLIEHRSLCPVAKEGEERNVKVDPGISRGSKLYKSLNEHTVGEQTVDHLLIRIGHSIGCQNLNGGVGGNGKGLARKRAAVYREYGIAAEDLRLLSHVFAIRLGNRFGHSDKRQIVGKSVLGKINHREGHIVYTALFLIVTKLELGAVNAVYGKVSLCAYNVGKACKSCSLLSRGVGVSLLVNDNGSSRHQHLVCHNRYLLIGIIGIFFFKILTDKNYDTAKVGSSH